MSELTLAIHDLTAALIDAAKFSRQVVDEATRAPLPTEIEVEIARGRAVSAEAEAVLAAGEVDKLRRRLDEVRGELSDLRRSISAKTPGRIDLLFATLLNVIHVGASPYSSLGITVYRRPKEYSVERPGVNIVAHGTQASGEGSDIGSALELFVENLSAEVKHEEKFRTEREAILATLPRVL